MTPERVAFSMKQWQRDMAGARGPHIQRMAIEAAFGLGIAAVALTALAWLLVLTWRLS
jgi:hypothetical protein